MDDVGRSLGERLRREADGVAPPPELAGRIHERVAARRRRRRLVEVGGVAAVVTALLAAPAAVHLKHRQNHPPNLAASTARPGMRLDVKRLSTIPRRLPGGKVFVPLGVGDNGAVVGEGSSPDGRVDGRVWHAGPGSGAPQTIAAANGLWAAHTDGERIVWPQTTTGAHDFELMCVEYASPERAATPPPRQLGNGGVTATENAFAADNGVVVWSDERDPPTVWAARSCGGPVQRLYRGGSAVAFCYPDVLVADVRNGRFNGHIIEVDLESGSDTQLLRAYGAVDLIGREGATFAVNARVLAWADGRRLTVLDRTSRRATAVRASLPAGDGQDGEITRLTAGNKILVFSARPQDGDPAAARSLVYDLRTGTAFSLPGESYAAGDMLLWRDRDSYRIGLVR